MGKQGLYFEDYTLEVLAPILFWLHDPGSNGMCLSVPYHPSFQISLCISVTPEFSSQRAREKNPKPKGYPRATSTGHVRPDLDKRAEISTYAR